ncbi:TRAP transporter substrate-binding protein DctP [Shimia abyssi]|uniref:TRAP-type C4-dicarboxylate transport system substrate-binding protein n=1 Tax=Shimia abyssi TaxID=1662395 RepID=A0A2P8FDD3_9RHOB|nr:TRAP transporter substrate-binding protein DctP [Shimia abyssi]PSL19730.1 TRAP-type C4-dicarboxylate transport system substrate-binding protein [Shimia abyssi]
MIVKSMKRTLLAGLSVALLSPLSAAAETKILFNIFVPPSHFYWDVMRDWATQVHDKSDGRLTIEFTPKSVAPPPKVMDAVRKGAADAGFLANIYLGPKNPGAHVGLMPWVHQGDSEATSVALWNTYQKYFSDAEKWRGVHLLGMYHFGGGALCSVTDEKIESAEDLSSRKVWSLKGNLDKMLKNLNVATVNGPAVQIHEIVSRNVVEAFTGITYDSVLQFKIASYTKSCVQFEKSPFSINFSHFINQRVWDGLSPEDQQVLTELSGEHLARMVGAKVTEQALAGRDELGQTVEYIQPSDALMTSLQEASKPVVDAWIAKVADMGVDGQAALDFMRAEVERLSTVNAN